MQHYQSAKLLRLHLTERDHYQGKPLYEAIVETCKDLNIAGASVFRALEGFGDTAEIHRSHVLTHDLPIIVQIVDRDENIQRLLPLIENMMNKGLIAISDVQMVSVHQPDGTRNV